LVQESYKKINTFTSNTSFLSIVETNKFVNNTHYDSMTKIETSSELYTLHFIKYASVPQAEIRKEVY